MINSVTEIGTWCVCVVQYGNKCPLHMSSLYLYQCVYRRVCARGRVYPTMEVICKHTQIQTHAQTHTNRQTDADLTCRHTQHNQSTDNKNSLKTHTHTQRTNSNSPKTRTHTHATTHTHTHTHTQIQTRNNTHKRARCDE